jgi:hypothetical protein
MEEEIDITPLPLSSTYACLFQNLLLFNSSQEKDIRHTLSQIFKTKTNNLDADIFAKGRLSEKLAGIELEILLLAQSNKNSNVPLP